MYREIIFLVGFPRSGTTLLKELLNNNDEIEFLSEETGFIPYLFSKIGLNNTFTNNTREAIYTLLSGTVFFKRMKKKGIYLEKEEFCHKSELINLEKVLEFLFCFYTRKKGIKIIGDKTPLYLLHIELLNKIFPRAKFIHLIRDPRDVVLSINKKWNRSILRSSEKWQIAVSRAQSEGHLLGYKKYYEVYYEDLIEFPENCLVALCSFLNCRYDKTMLQLHNPISSGGGLSDSTKIVSFNKNKYHYYISKRKLKRIEEICFNVITKLPYAVFYGKKNKKLNQFIYKLLYLYDVFSMTYSITKQSGIKIAFQEMFYKYREKIKKSPLKKYNKGNQKIL